MISSTRADATRSFMDELERYVRLGLHTLGCMQDDRPHGSFTLLELRDAIRKSIGVKLSYKHDAAIKTVLADLERSRKNTQEAGTCSPLPAGWVQK